MKSEDSQSNVHTCSKYRSNCAGRMASCGVSGTVPFIRNDVLWQVTSLCFRRQKQAADYGRPMMGKFASRLQSLGN
jgi:hypothetical protein